MDTVNNQKIKMAEKCVKDLEKYIGNIREIKRGAILKEVSSKIMEIKYSYAEVDEMEESLNEIKKICNDIVTLLGKDKWIKRLKEMKLSDLAVAHIKFCLNILYNLDFRLRLPDAPEYSVDIRVGEIESITKHPNAKKLKICNVNVGRVITVVTNIENVKERERLAVALLPPAEFFGVVSEGMFLSHNLKEGNPGEIPLLTEDERNNVKKEVFKYLR